MWRLLIPFFFLSEITMGTDPDPDCLVWFKRANIKVGSKDCKLSCATLPADMGTFMCPNQCARLCNTKPAEPLLAKFILYPGLTPTEKSLVAKNPEDALTVYKQNNIAEESATRNFPDQNLNDESDAFRHFLWAALLTKELGQAKAKEFLDAHEADPDQPDIERQMDLHNNIRGQAATQTLIEKNRWSQKNIEAKGLEELRSKRLHVLKPSLQMLQIMRTDTYRYRRSQDEKAYANFCNSLRPPPRRRRSFRFILLRGRLYELF